MRATTTQQIILAVVLTSIVIQNLPLAARAEDEKKTDEKTEKAENPLLGTWTVASAVADGQPVHVPFLYSFTKTGIENVDLDRQVAHKGSYIIDVTRSPHRLDTSTVINGRRRNQQNIYRFIEGGRVELCCFADRNGCPSDFKWSPTNRISTVVLERQGEKPPTP